MAEPAKKASNEWEERASKTFSAERKEDFFVLALAGITVALVWTGLINPNFFKSLFF